MSLLPPFNDPALLEELVAIRRRYHAYPELSWAEFHTTARLCEELEALGFEVSWGEALYGQRRPHNPPPPAVLDAAYQRAEQALGAGNRYLPAMRGGLTGLVATLEGAAPGPVYGFRFDIDALPIGEQADPPHAPAAGAFHSRNAGVMHACGHDGHLTIGLGLARRLAARRDQLQGRVHLFFQPAEEVAGGGAVFAELPQLQEVERFLTLHLGIINERKLVCDTRWLAARIFDVVFQGRASHAGNSPQEGCNALLAACQAVQGLYSLPRHSAGMSRVNVGRFHSDNAHNVIADEVRFRFEVRGGNNEVCEYLSEAAQRVLEGAARMQGVRCESRLYSRFDSQPNSPGLVREVQQHARALGIPESAIIERYQVPASEDATFMIRRVQERGGEGTYLILGCPVVGGHHNACFDIDEDLLGWGVELLSRLVEPPG